MPLRRLRDGFTVLELAIVIAVLAILLGVAAARYKDLLRLAHEGALEGNLGALRSALSMYYADMEGQYPTDAMSLTVHARYLKSIPLADPPTHHAGQAGFSYAGHGDTSRWGYDNDPDSKAFGTLWVDCTHTDLKGKTWNTY
ncbi:MAG TPA: type II secretion system protein [Elusimicrobiota bacterium]|nr:type II secretion system protein [Elusimicrobiota bacterium]